MEAFSVSFAGCRVELFLFSLAAGDDHSSGAENQNDASHVEQGNTDTASSSMWIWAQFVQWAKIMGGPEKVFRIVIGRKYLIAVLVMETIVLLGIGTAAIIRNRERILKWCRRKLSRMQVTDDDVRIAQEVIRSLNLVEED